MLTIGAPLFLLVPDSSKKRILHPGKVMELTQGVLVARMDEPLVLPEGTEVVAFQTIGNRFMQQGAVVVAQGEAREYYAVAFKLVGEAASAEQRQIYRVSVPIANIKARVGNEVDCHVVDVSSEGCAIVTRQEFKIGSSVKINFSYEGVEVSADARIQTAKKREDGKYRCGFFIAEKKSPARKALAAISIATQRQQLKRLAGAA